MEAKLNMTLEEVIKKDKSSKFSNKKFIKKPRIKKFNNNFSKFNKNGNMNKRNINVNTVRKTKRANFEMVH